MVESIDKLVQLFHKFVIQTMGTPNSVRELQKFIHIDMGK